MTNVCLEANGRTVDDREKQVNVKVAGRIENSAVDVLLPRHALSMDDPDLLGGPACVLLRLLDEPPRHYDRLARQHLKSILERTETWHIPKARVEELFRYLEEQNLHIEVLKKAQALVPAKSGENLESEIVRRKAEVDKWKIEMLKGIVFKVMKENQALQKEAQEVRHEMGQKEMEMEAIRMTAQELTDEVGGKNINIEGIRSEAIAEVESRVASSIAALTRKAEEDELKIESLQKQLAEQSRAVEVLEIRRRATTTKFKSVSKDMKRKVQENELRIEALQKQLAAKVKEGWEDFRPAKRTKLKGDDEHFVRVEVVGEEQEPAKLHSKDDAGKDKPTVNDGSHPVKPGVGANFGEEGEEISLPVLVPDSVSEEEEMFSPVSDPGSDEEVFVPDSEFHDFDVARMGMGILPGQIWAVYDDQDGMPRFYARISRVTTKPFRAHLEWLDSSSATDEETAWTKSTGLSITCGDFKVGKSSVMDSVSTFSHVLLDQVGTGLIKVYPKKGQVWAVYRDPVQEIEPEGRPQFDGEGTTLKYDIVEILSDYEIEGLRTWKLIKIKGFNTVFCRQDGIESYKSFKREELVKFSHQIPNHRIEASQTEERRIPLGSLELDPGATPDYRAD